MPLRFDNPVTTQIVLNSSEVQGFSINNKAGIMDIQYYDGNLDVNNVFTPVGELKNLHIEGNDFTAILIANPTLYPMLKNIVNNLVAQSKGLTGVVV